MVLWSRGRDPHAGAVLALSAWRGRLTRHVQSIRRVLSLDGPQSREDKMRRLERNGELHALRQYQVSRPRPARCLSKSEREAAWT
jgi:hypothetical protein